MLWRAHAYRWSVCFGRCLGGCYTMNGAGSSGGGAVKPTTPTTPTPGTLTSFNGIFTGRLWGPGGTTNQFTNVTKFDDPSDGRL